MPLFGDSNLAQVIMQGAQMINQSIQQRIEMEQKHAERMESLDYKQASLEYKEKELKAKTSNDLLEIENKRLHEANVTLREGNKQGNAEALLALKREIFENDKLKDPQVMALKQADQRRKEVETQINQGQLELNRLKLDQTTAIAEAKLGLETQKVEGKLADNKERLGLAKEKLKADLELSKERLEGVKAQTETKKEALKIAGETLKLRQHESEAREKINELELKHKQLQLDHDKEVSKIKAEDADLDRGIKEQKLALDRAKLQAQMALKLQTDALKNLRVEKGTLDLTLKGLDVILKEKAVEQAVFKSVNLAIAGNDREKANRVYQSVDELAQRRNAVDRQLQDLLSKGFGQYTLEDPVVQEAMAQRDSLDRSINWRLDELAIRGYSKTDAAVPIVQEPPPNRGPNFESNQAEILKATLPQARPEALDFPGIFHSLLDPTVAPDKRQADLIRFRDAMRLADNRGTDDWVLFKSTAITNAPAGTTSEKEAIVDQLMEEAGKLPD